jgi:hypothetical protein
MLTIASNTTSGSVATRRTFRRFIISMLALAVISTVSPANAQYEHRFNFNVGGSVVPLVGDISSRLNTGWNVTAGGGVNLAPTFGINAEYSYFGLGVDQSVLNSLDVPEGNAHIHAITVNPMWRFVNGERFGAYAIAGVGYYRRTVEFTQPTTALVTVFDPWWGYVGPFAVPAHQVLGSATSNAGGVNAGFGLTLGTKGGVKFYTEARYHYANTHRSRTQMVPVTFGIRW